MKLAIGFDAYRWEEVGHDVPFRLIGPRGKQHRQISRAGSAMFAAMPDRATGMSSLASFLWLLNVAHRKFPDAAERFIASVAGCREVADAFVAQLEIPWKGAKEKDGSRWLHPKGELHGRVAGALVALGDVTARLREIVFGGQDPTKVNKELSRTGGAHVVENRKGRGYRSDTDRLLRMGKDTSSAPRYDDPRFFDRLLVGMKAIGTPEAIEGLARLARYSGGRWCSVSSVTIYDVLCGPAAKDIGKHITATTKGSEGATVIELIPGDEQMAWIYRFIDGPRKRASGMSLARLKAWAANPKKRAALKQMPLFTEDGVNAVPYLRMYRFFRRAAERQGLFIDDVEYRLTGRRRYLSFHYLRHEYVHHRLDVCLTMSAVEQIAERKAIIAYMGWESGERMLKWYSAHHVVKLAHRSARTFNERTTEKVAVSTVKKPSAFQAGAAATAAMLSGLA
ncbi:hypothetical protein [Sphingomonas sp.]|uniref:hypothetical protein n=1 Tax=Sphingomonas sp. TaxID=28214 RepID=UPI002DD6201F|nr:hypothetical protein [Sphingomonas sp.]